jgi:hypothetical protein
MPERLNRVQVGTAFGIVTLSWEARDRLVAELRHLESLSDVTADFENARASRTVVIPQELGTAVARVIESIGSNSSGGLRGLEGGLFELRNALRDELA